MNLSRLRCLFAVPLAFLGLALGVPASAQSPAPAPEAPVDTTAADAVLDDYVAAIGGAQVFDKIETRVTKVKLAAPSLGVEIPVTTFQKSPDRVMAEQTVPGLGTMIQGYDGKVAWSFNSLQGYRELEGGERAQLLAGADLRNELNLKLKYPTRERLADITTDGATLQVVRLSGGELPVTTYYFDAKTRLAARMDMVVDGGPTGQIPTSTKFEDYRAVGGLLVPHRMVVKGGPMEMQMTIESIELNVPIDDAKFAPKKS